MSKTLDEYIEEMEQVDYICTGCKHIGHGKLLAGSLTGVPHLGCESGGVWIAVNETPDTINQLMDVIEELVHEVKLQLDARYRDGADYFDFDVVAEKNTRVEKARHLIASYGRTEQLLRAQNAVRKYEESKAK